MKIAAKKRKRKIFHLQRSNLSLYGSQSSSMGVSNLRGIRGMVHEIDPDDDGDSLSLMTLATKIKSRGGDPNLPAHGESNVTS